MTDPLPDGRHTVPSADDLERLMTGEVLSTLADRLPAAIVQSFEEARRIVELIPEPVADARLATLFAQRPDAGEHEAVGLRLVPEVPAVVAPDPQQSNGNGLNHWSVVTAPVPAVQQGETCLATRLNIPSQLVADPTITGSEEAEAPSVVRLLGQALVGDRIDRRSIVAIIAAAAVLVVAVGFYASGFPEVWRQEPSKPANVAAVDGSDEDRPTFQSTALDSKPQSTTERPARPTITTTRFRGKPETGQRTAETSGPSIKGEDGPSATTTTFADVGPPSTAPGSAPTVPSSTTSTTTNPGSSATTLTAPTSPSIPTTSLPPASITTTVPKTTTTVSSTTATPSPTTTSPAAVVYLAPGWTYVVPAGLAPGIYYSITSAFCEITVVYPGGGFSVADFAPGEITVIYANHGDQVYTSPGCPGWYQESR